MTDDFKLEIISPEKVLFSEKVTSVTIPSFEGEMSILSEHIPLITFLRPGLIKILGKKEINYFLEDRTVEFSNNNLIILSSTIIEAKNLSKEKISIMIQESEKKLKDENSDDKSRYIAFHKVDTLSRIN